jgi:tetratricopeptide (TPR) repeat protein
LLSMVVAGVLTLGVALLRGGAMKRIALVILAIAMLGFGVLLYVGFERVYERVTTPNTALEYRGRVQMIADALRAWKEFPITGVGLGAHEMVFPLYEHGITPAVASHVENEYAQALEETGIVGLGIICAFVGLIWWRYTQAVRSAAPAAIGLGYGLAAVMVHSLSDFGQHIPAVACMSAAVCGMIMNLGMRRAGELPQRRSVWRVLFTIGCALLSIWVLFSAVRTFEADRSFNTARRIYERLEDREWKGSDEQYSEMIARTRDAVRLTPGNIEYRRWLGTYEWRALSRERNAQGEVVLSGEDVAQVERLVDELHQARRLAPTYGPIYYVVGQLEDLVLDRPAGVEHIRRAYALWPNDPQAVLLAAEIDAREGRFAAADEKLRRVVAMSPAYLEDAVEVYTKQVNQPQRVLEVLAGNWQHLVTVSNYFSLAGYPQLAVEARDRAAAILKPLADRPDAPLTVIAHMADVSFGQQKFDQAADYYARALKQDYGQVYWHHLRARSLINARRFDEARSEISATLSIDPNHQGAKDLLRQIQEKR